MYGNDTGNVQAASDAEIFINQSNNNTVTNNIGVPGVYGSTGVIVSGNTAAGGTSTTTPPAAPVISTGVANANETVTLTGTAPDGSTVTVSDGTTLGTTTTSSSGSWSYTTTALACGTYAFTATDTTSAGTIAGSSAFDVTVTAPAPTSPAAPVISTGVANANETVILTGTAPDGSTVTVSDGTTLGTTTTSSSGSWSYTTTALAAGTSASTATDTTSAGTSTASSAVDVTVTSSSSSTGSSPPPSGSNLIANGNFATGDFTELDSRRQLHIYDRTVYRYERRRRQHVRGSYGFGGLGRYLKPDHRDDSWPDLYAELLAAERRLRPG